MAHTCKALMLGCIDYRFQTGFQQFVESENLKNDCDRLHVAGAVKGLVESEGRHPEPAEGLGDDTVVRDYILGQIEISAKLHEIKEILLVNHRDCGAYGGTPAFADKAAEHEHHRNELLKAKALLENRFPSITIKTLFAEIDESVDPVKVWVETI